MFSPPYCALGWVFLIILDLGCHSAFVANLWILLGSTFIVAHMVKKRWHYMMLCKIFSQALQEMQKFMFNKNKLMSFYLLPYNICVIKLTLCY
jgi:hypothetical protein